MRHTNKIIVTALLIAVGLLTDHFAHAPAAIAPALIPSSSVPPGYVRVRHAIDGDTIELEDGRRVRYLGIDTPETVHPKKAVQCWGPQASARNHELVDGVLVWLVRDIEDTDRYGRLLRYVYLSDGTFVNKVLVSGGFARVYTYPPNIAHTIEFQEAQNQAKQAIIGLWSSCGT